MFICNFFCKEKNSLQRKKVVVFLCAMLFSSVSSPASELSFKVVPGAIFPFLSENDYYYPVGFNAFLDGGVNVNHYINIGASIGLFIMPKSNFTELRKGVSTTMTFIPFGARVEFVGYPGSRIELCGGLAAGVGLGINDTQEETKTLWAPWYKVYGDVMYRINPNFSLGLNVAWFDYQSTTFFGSPAMAGVSAGISAKFKFETEKMVHNVKAAVEQDGRIFPLLASLYKENPFGTVSIINNESAEIKNVKVSFKATDYTSSDMVCGTISKIFKGEIAQVPLVADFSERILQFSEAGDFPAEIVIEYELLGKKRRTVESVIISVHNRNQVTWIDPAVLSAYISPKSEQVLHLSKILSGLARGQLVSGMNRNLQFAMYIFEGMRLSGIECKADTSTPYASFHLDYDALDYIQYPFQTLLYKSGDVDDVGILFMALLEASNIEAGYIPLANDFIVLIDMKTPASKISSLMDGEDRAVILDDEVWIPVSMSTLREGFVNSWYNAVNELFLAAENGEDETCYILQDGWTIYPAASFHVSSATPESPLETLLISSVETNIARYNTAEYGPQLAAIQYQMNQTGVTVELLNKLGLTYVRAGMYSSAIQAYEKSAAMGSVAAMNNLGNIAIIQSRYADAKVWYEKVLAISPNNATAIKGLDRALGRLGD